MTVGPEQGLTQGKLCKCCEQVLCRCFNVCTYLVILSPDVMFFAHENLLIIANTLTLHSFVWIGEDFWMIFPFQFIGNSGRLLNSKVRVFDYNVEGSLTKVLTRDSNPVWPGSNYDLGLWMDMLLLNASNSIQGLATIASPFVLSQLLKLRLPSTMYSLSLQIGWL